MVYEATSDPVIQRLLEEDKTPWYKKPNLRKLYLILIPCCLGVEATSGFDSSLMNGVQSLRYWTEFFGSPKGASLGILTAAYSLGAITALPFNSILSDHVGRRWSIAFGSVVMIAGAIMQAFSVNCVSLANFIICSAFFLIITTNMYSLSLSKLLCGYSHACF
jgi:MFS family permease